jgi:hypothetical protein
VNHTHLFQDIFNNEITDWRFFSVIISRTNALVIRSGLYRVQMYRKYGTASCGGKDCKILVWFTSGNRSQTKLTNILTTASYLLHVHDYNRNQIQNVQAIHKPIMVKYNVKRKCHKSKIKSIYNMAFTTTVWVREMSPVFGTQGI